MQGKTVILIEMGHTQSTAVVVKIGSFESNDVPLATKLSHATNDNLGALDFDLKLFEHFSNICASKHGGAVIPGSKRGQRLILGCERIRKLLSQLPESSITVENMSDSGDVNFSLKRNDLISMCANLLEAFKVLIKKALTSAGIQSGNIIMIKCILLDDLTHKPLFCATLSQNRVILAVKIFVYVYFPRSIMRILAET